MYKAAYKHDDSTVCYYDEFGFKHVVKGGALAWRLNNPGLVRTHTPVATFYGAIGSFDGYAIFSCPDDGHKALADWIHFKKYQMSNLVQIATHYQPNDIESFVKKLVAFSGIASKRKIKTLNKEELAKLLFSIEKLCGYSILGDEKHEILPKIVGKIEYPVKGQEAFLIENYVILAKEEAIEWVKSLKLDAIVVHGANGLIYLRSRPSHCFQHILQANYLHKEIPSVVRTIGKKKEGQCIWGFINGIDNTKESALQSATLISESAGGEEVFYMPNDTAGKAKDILIALALKAGVNTQVIDRAINFFKYLLAIAEKENSFVVLFVHSQSAIIAEHTLAFLNLDERKKIRIFALGGGSYILPGLAHPETHNYASYKDAVNFLGAPLLRSLALQRYWAANEGKSEKQLIQLRAEQDALLYLESMDFQLIETFIEQRIRYYENKFAPISNVTILDSEGDNDHEFRGKCYQKQLRAIVKKYREASNLVEV
jgi:hypothetical protein